MKQQPQKSKALFLQILPRKKISKMVSLRILSMAFCLSLTCRSSFCSPAPEARKEAIEAILEALEKRLEEETSDSSTLDLAVCKKLTMIALLALSS